MKSGKLLLLASILALSVGSAGFAETCSGANANDTGARMDVIACHLVAKRQAAANGASAVRAGSNALNAEIDAMVDDIPDAALRIEMATDPEQAQLWSARICTTAAGETKTSLDVCVLTFDNLIWMHVYVAWTEDRDLIDYVVERAGRFGKRDDVMWGYREKFMR